MLLLSDVTNDEATAPASPALPPPAPPLFDPSTERTIRTAMWIGGLLSGGALTYHGYKRNNSVGWALVWGIFGGMVWPLTVPIAFAQGFGKSRKGV